jgi:predicted aconitase
MFFVDLRDNVIPFMSRVEGVTEAGTYAVIHSLESDPAPMPDSCLLSSGIRTKAYNLVSTSSFKDTAFVIDVGCPRKSVVVIRPNSEWAQLFC